MCTNTIIHFNYTLYLLAVTFMNTYKIRNSNLVTVIYRIIVPYRNSVKVIVEMEGGNKNTFAKIPILVKGLVSLDNPIHTGLFSSIKTKNKLSVFTIKDYGLIPVKASSQHKNIIWLQSFSSLYLQCHAEVKFLTFILLNQDNHTG